MNDNKQNSDTDLLQAWLNAAETQICSLEVLNTLIPDINNLLENSMNELGESFSALAAHSQSQAQNLSNILDNLESLTIDGEDVSVISAVEKAVAFNSQIQNPNKELEEYLDKILESIQNKNQIMQSIRTISQHTSQEIINSLSQIIMAMQFQDRVSQNLVISNNIIKSNISHLKQNIDDTTKEYQDSNHCEKIKIDIEFTKELLGIITLGALRKQFIDNLLAHGYIKSADDIGSDSVKFESNDNEVELF